MSILQFAPLFIGMVMGLIFPMKKETNLPRSKFQPPDYVFMIVWPVLYLMLGKSIETLTDIFDIALFGGHMALNYEWVPLFVLIKRKQFAFYVIIALIISGGIFILRDCTNRWYLIFYQAWLFFAAFLNWDIMKEQEG